MIGVPMDDHRQIIGLAANDAMEEACLSMGLEFKLLEFIPAMRLLATESNAADRWLNREEVFGAAHRPDIIEAAAKAGESYE